MFKQNKDIQTFDTKCISRVKLKREENSRINSGAENALGDLLRIASLSRLSNFNPSVIGGLPLSLSLYSATSIILPDPLRLNTPANKLWHERLSMSFYVRQHLVPADFFPQPPRVAYIELYMIVLCTLL